MKIGLLLTLLFIGQVASAQTIREKRIKEEMLERVDSLVTKLQEARQDLSIEDVISACARINEAFMIFPEHLKSVGTHMNLFDRRTIKVKNDALSQLIFLHQQTLLCSRGRESEYINPRELNKKLKDLQKSLGKQRKHIRKSDTSYENNFYYEYQF